MYAFLVKVLPSGASYDYGGSGATLTSNTTLLAHGRGTSQGWTTSTGLIPEDGFYRFRFVNGSFDASGGKALGANPVPMAFGEVYTALQTGAVDGQDNPLPTVQKSKFYEVTKQIVLTNHLVDLNYVTISKKVWDKLTPAQQATVQKAADAAARGGAAMAGAGTTVVKATAVSNAKTKGNKGFLSF